MDSPAGEVMNLTGELRRLLDAILPVASDLSLPVVLERIVASACELAEDETLAEFITVGIDADTIARIGPPRAGTACSAC